MDEINIACVQIIGRHKLGNDDHAVEREQKNAGCKRKAVAPEFPPHQPQL
jgi:hypothetical protein